MSLLVFQTLVKFYLDLNDLTFINRFVGWFLVEYLIEDYNLTGGKLFLTSEDFRTLIKNSVVITRNFFFLAQVFTPLEFFFVNLFLISLIVFCKPKKFYNFFKFGIIISYYCIFQSFLLINYFLIFLIFKNALIISVIFLTLITYNYILYTFLFVNIKTNQLVFKYIIFIFKFGLYIMCNVSVLVGFNIILFNNCGVLENFVQEFLVFCLIPYTFLFFINLC